MIQDIQDINGASELRGKQVSKETILVSTKFLLNPVANGM